MNAPTLYLTQGSGNSFKPALVARQCHRSLQTRYLDVLANETSAPWFLAINPRGQVPYLVTAEGLGLGESNALAWYLAEGSALLPAAPLHQAQCIQWMIFEQTALEPNIGAARFYTCFAPEREAEREADFPRWMAQGNQGLAVLDAHLRGRRFVTDHGYSVADVAVFGYTHLAAEGGFDLQAFPAIGDWIKRVEDTPDYLPIGQLLQPAPEAVP